MAFISEINGEQVALCGSVKLAARQPFFFIKVIAFVIQCQEYWSWQPRHASCVLTTSVGGIVPLPLSDLLIHPAGADLLQKGGAHGCG